MQPQGSARRLMATFSLGGHQHCLTADHPLRVLRSESWIQEHASMLRAGDVISTSSECRRAWNRCTAWRCRQHPGIPKRFTCSLQTPASGAMGPSTEWPSWAACTKRAPASGPSQPLQARTWKAFFSGDPCAARAERSAAASAGSS